MATFGEVLTEYMELVGCSGQALSKCTGISPGTISRYKSGSRTPEAGSDIPSKIAKGLFDFAAGGDNPLDEEAILTRLLSTVEQNEPDFPDFSTRFDKLAKVLGISTSAIAGDLGFNPSYVSRIRNGNRTPANPTEFIEGVSRYIGSNFSSDKDLTTISTLLGCTPDSLKGSDLGPALNKWFTGAHVESENPLAGFLEKIATFDSSDYMRQISLLKNRFASLRIPKLTNTRFFYGPDRIQVGVIEFLLYTLKSEMKESMFMYSEVPQTEESRDSEYTKDVSLLIGNCLKKGHRLDVVFNSQNGVKDLIPQLEDWLPLIMTGRVSPYYIKSPGTGMYSHLEHFSGSVAYSGELVNEGYSKGRAILSNDKDDIAYSRKKIIAILSKAASIMDIYKGDSPKLKQFTDSLDDKNAKTLQDPQYPGLTIGIFPGNCIIISRDSAPITHFVIREPEIVKLASDFYL